jgi:hypothetical protein
VSPGEREPYGTVIEVGIQPTIHSVTQGAVGRESP